MTSAVLFPGLAPSNHRSVGAFMARDPFTRRRLREADQVLGRSLLAGFRAAGRESTADSQLAFVINCLALADRAKWTMGMSARLALGPSFGQFAALAHLGVLPFPDVVRLVTAFAAVEREYFAVHHTDTVTRFVFRIPESGLQAALDQLDAGGEWHEVACHLGGGFSAVTLRRHAVPRFDSLVRSAGGVPLYSLRPPVHSSRFGPLRDRFAQVCAQYAFADPCLPVVSDHDGSVVTTGTGVRDLLLDGIVRPVHWPAVVASLHAAKITTVWVPGPSNLFDRLAQGAFEVRAVNPENASDPGRSRVAG